MKLPIKPLYDDAAEAKRAIGQLPKPENWKFVSFRSQFSGTIKYVIVPKWY